jgi:adenylate cyclase
LRFSLDREWPWGVLAVTAATALWLLDPGGLVERAREAAFEAVGSAFPRTGGSGAVTIIDIDRESLARHGPWPWRRSLVAELVETAAAGGPRAIGIDILLSGADRKGPAALARELAHLSGRSDIAADAFEDDDRRLASAIAAAGNVVLGMVLDDAGTDVAPIPTPLAVEGNPEGIVPRSASGVIAPHEPFALGAGGTGVLSFQAGVLGRVTAAPLLTLVNGEAFPGFALEIVRLAEGSAVLTLKDEPARIAAGAVEVPLGRNAEMRLHFSRESFWQGRVIPAWRLLTGEADAADLPGKIVLIGSSAPESGAFLPVAASPLMPTVRIHAEAVEQMLTGRFLVRPDGAPLWEAAAMLALGLAAVALAVQLPPAWTALAAIGLAICWWAAIGAAFVRYGLLVDPIGPAAAAIIGANVTAFAAFVRTRRLKAAIQQRFERYVPPEVVARFVREPQSLKLDGELREVTALLTDVEGFSAMTERSDPQRLVRVLDGYFDRVTELIVAHGGMVDKIVGDAVLAFFNIPAPLPGHANAAVRCAQAIVAATEAFRREAEPLALGFGRTRSGIESGSAIVGDVGGRRRLDYTAYGVVVNKAARFQDANKRLGSAICIGPAAAAMLDGGIALRPLGRIPVRGMQGLAEVFEPWPEGVPEEVRARYAEAVAASECDAERSRRLFAQLAEQMPDDMVIRTWLERLRGTP